MTALILAAGYGTRLGSYTRVLPKGLLPVGGRPLLEYGVEQLERLPALERILLVTNGKYGEAFGRWTEGFASRSPRLAVEIVNDGTTSAQERLGSLGDLALVLEKKGLAGDLLVLPSDKLFEFSLGDFLAAYESRREALNACHDLGDPALLRGKHGCVVVDGAGRILDYEEKPERPKSSLASIALYLFPERVLRLLPAYLSEGGNPDSPGYFCAWLHRRVPLYAWIFREACHDVGTVEAYERLRALLANQPS